MARESVKILQGKLDVESLISQLNAALAEEWLAYYQYWVGALVVEGAMRADVQGEFEEHAEEERRHAQLLADRIIELEAQGHYLSYFLSYAHTSQMIHASDPSKMQSQDRH